MNYLDSLQQATNKTRTENGAATNVSSLNPCLDFFALGAAKRGRDGEALTLFSKALAKDELTAIRTLFYIRDVRGGQGERKIFRTCLEFLSTARPDLFDKVFEYVEEYGRWDDLVTLNPSITDNKKVVAYVENKLKEDLRSETPSLLGKWMPSENASSDDAVKMAKRWQKALGLKPRAYRNMLTNLRKKIKLLEQKMSAKEWSTIEYDKIPSQAFRKHTKAFRRNDEDRFEKFLEEVNKEKAKINTSTVSTAEVLQNVRNDSGNSATNAIWKSLDNFVPEDLNAIVVADVSGSMYGRPMDISTSLALYFAERNKGYFANKFMTFSITPRVVEVLGDTLTEKLRNISTADWGMNTDIEATFDALLNAAIYSGDFENVPKVIYIISDMEFDYCATGADETVFENAKRKWGEKGLELPTVVFWNVESRGDNLPATKFDDNVILMSGSSQNSFRYAMQRKKPEDFMNEVVNSERYAKITL